jgi:hypothetical protein
MKRMLFLLIVSPLLITSPVVCAQDSLDQTVTRLQNEIARREVIDRDESTPPELRPTNRALLEQRRAELLNAVQARIAALQKYLETLGDSITPQEKTDAQSSLRKLATATNSASAPRPSERLRDVRLGNRQTFTTEPQPTRVPSYVVPTSLGSSSAVNSSTPNQSVPFQVTAPNDHEKSAVETIDVRVKVDPPAEYDFDLNVSVTNGGEKVGIHMLSIKKGETTGRVPVKLKAGSNDINIGGAETRTVTFQPVPGPANQDGNKKQKGKIQILEPTANKDVYNQTFVPIKIKVFHSDPMVRNIYVRVLNRDQPVTQPENPLSVKYSEDNKPAEISVRLKILEGKNEVLVFDREKPLENFASLNISCEGKNCGIAMGANEGEFSRTILGFEQIGASSAESAQKPFMDLFISNPLTSNGRARIWGDIRLSAASQANLELGSFTQSLLAPGLTGKANQLVQAVSVTSGLELKLRETGLVSGFGGTNKQRIGVGFLLGAGFTTPFSPRDTIAEFSVTDAARTQFSIPAGKTVLAFISPDRDRFLRQYFGGLRFTTRYYEDNGEPAKLFPATFDITIGQNEAVTQRLRGTVLRLEGFYPLPIEKAKFVYLFGSGLLKLHRARIDDNPLVLDPVTKPLALSDASVFALPAPQANRDSYRLGIGVDLLQLLKPKEPKQSETPQQ